MKPFTALLLFSLLTTSAFAVDLSKVPHCSLSTKKPTISEDLIGEFEAENEYIRDEQHVPTIETFRITSNEVLEVPQIYSVYGDPLVQQPEKSFCFSLKRKAQSTLKLKLIEKKRHRFSTDKTVFTYWLTYSSERNSYSWNYKISNHDYLLFVLPIGSSFWSTSYPVQKIQ